VALHIGKHLQQGGGTHGVGGVAGVALRLQAAEVKQRGIVCLSMARRIDQQHALAPAQV
jgi:hypothetical protein